MPPDEICDLRKKLRCHVFEICERTDRHTYKLIAILHCRVGLRARKLLQITPFSSYVCGYGRDRHTDGRTIALIDSAAVVDEA